MPRSLKGMGAQCSPGAGVGLDLPPRGGRPPDRPSKGSLCLLSWLCVTCVKPPKVWPTLLLGGRSGLTKLGRLGAEACTLNSSYTNQSISLSNKQSVNLNQVSQSIISWVNRQAFLCLGLNWVSTYKDWKCKTHLTPTCSIRSVCLWPSGSHGCQLSLVRCGHWSDSAGWLVC